MRIVSRVEFNDKDRNFYYYAQTLELTNKEKRKFFEVK